MTSLSFIVHSVLSACSSFHLSVSGNHLASLCLIYRKWVWISTLTCTPTPLWWMASCMVTSLRKRIECRGRPSFLDSYAKTRLTSLLWVSWVLPFFPFKTQRPSNCCMVVVFFFLV